MLYIPEKLSLPVKKICSLYHKFNLQHDISSSFLFLPPHLMNSPRLAKHSAWPSNDGDLYFFVTLMRLIFRTCRQSSVMMILLTEQAIFFYYFFFRVEDGGCWGLVPVLQHD